MNEQKKIELQKQSQRKLADVSPSDLSILSKYFWLNMTQYEGEQNQYFLFVQMFHFVHLVICYIVFLILS